MPELSVIIPVYNEESNIHPLALRIRESLRGLDYEIIWVNDGSTDQSGERIRQAADERTWLVELERNYGQSAAMQAGIDLARGSYISFLDGDGQNDPSDIRFMLDHLKQGDWDLVAGNRRHRKDKFSRKITSAVANRMIRMLGGVRVSDYGCTLKLMRRSVAKDLSLTRGRHRFIPLLAHRSGARICEVDVSHHPRTAGTSKYGWNRIFKVTFDIIILCLFHPGKNRRKLKKQYQVRQVCSLQKNPSPPIFA